VNSFDAVLADFAAGLRPDTDAVLVGAIHPSLYVLRFSSKIDTTCFTKPEYQSHFGA
jgi:hypothetical protein